MPGVIFLVSLCCSIGLCLYANFYGCDPLTNPNASERIRNPNQLVGYFVVNNLKSIPGAAGIFLGSLFCGSLSSVSSYLNSSAVIIWQDIFKLFAYFRQFDDASSLRTNKLIALCCGLGSTGLAFLISRVGGNLIQISTSINAALQAPLLGMFLLGMLFSITTPRGVIVGSVVGFLCGVWINIGAMVVKPVYDKLEVSIELCPNVTDVNVMLLMNTTLSSSLPVVINGGGFKVASSELTGFDKFYSLSYMWYVSFGIVVTMLVWLVVSVCDGGLKNELKERKEFVYFDLCGCFVKNKK